MYERFTDRARKVMQLANQEAQRFNHEYIGTEHILLGLLKEGTGCGPVVLQNLGVDFAQLTLNVHALLQYGPEMVTMGKLPQTPRAKKCIEWAMECARELHHNHVGSEHLLLGLAKESDGIASQELARLGATFDKIREQVAVLVGGRESESPPNLSAAWAVHVQQLRVGSERQERIDHSANLAMQGMLSCQDFMNEVSKAAESKTNAREIVARLAYDMAETLEAEREKRYTPPR